MTRNELNDAEIIGTLQWAYRWGYPLLAMVTNNRVLRIGDERLL